jgi:hypothetical protein
MGSMPVINSDKRAGCVDKILRGAQPAALPGQHRTKEDLTHA